MELRHLRYFLAVADTLHVGRAARKLHISQPAVSQQLRELEGELGETLFERHARGVRLTPAGEVFRVHASRVLEDVRAGERALAAFANKQVGELRVAYLPSTTANLVIPAVAAVMKRYPGARVIAYEGVSRRVERLVAEGRADVGLGLLPVRRTDLVTEPVVEGRLSLVVHAKHPLAGEASASLRDVAKEPFALLSRSLRARALADAALARAGVEPTIALEADAVATVLAVVRAGLAVAVLPEPRVRRGDDLAVVPLRPRAPPHVTALLYRASALRSPLTEAFGEEVRAVAGRRLDEVR